MAKFRANACQKRATAGGKRHPTRWRDSMIWNTPQEQASRNWKRNMSNRRRKTTPKLTQRVEGTLWYGIHLENKQAETGSETCGGRVQICRPVHLFVNRFREYQRKVRCGPDPCRGWHRYDLWLCESFNILYRCLIERNDGENRKLNRNCRKTASGRFIGIRVSYNLRMCRTRSGCQWIIH